MIAPALSGKQVVDPDLSIASFLRIAQIAKNNWGLHLMEAKRPLIKSRLRKRIQILGLNNYEDYCTIIEGNDESETKFLISAITTNVTHFYREVHHFDHLESNVLPKLLEKAKLGERVRLWSAGCSSGQEPYSLAGSILAIDAKASSYNLKILATDVDHKILQTAEAGSYRKSDTSFPSNQYESRIFNKSKLEGSSQDVRPELRSLVSFKLLNLMDDWPFTGQFDVIMCRNVAIYFDKPTQQKLWSRFAKCLTPIGNLYIGHSERIHDQQAAGLKASGITTYERVRPNP